MKNEESVYDRTNSKFRDKDGNKGLITGLLIALALVLIISAAILSNNHKKRIQ